MVFFEPEKLAGVRPAPAESAEVVSHESLSLSEEKDIDSGFSSPGRTPKKLYKIGEIMSHTGISRQTIHNYTMMGLITEAERTDSGHRLYDETAFDRLAKIERLKRHHTLREIKKMVDLEEVRKVK